MTLLSVRELDLRTCDNDVVMYIRTERCQRSLQTIRRVGKAMPNSDQNSYPPK